MKGIKINLHLFTNMFLITNMLLDFYVHSFSCVQAQYRRGYNFGTYCTHEDYRLKNKKNTALKGSSMAKTMKR